MRNTKIRVIFATLLLLITVVVFVPQAIAIPQYAAMLNTVYGNGSCTNCHADPNGGKSLTDYGVKFSSQSAYATDPVAALRTIGAPSGAAATVVAPVVTETIPAVTATIPVATAGTSKKSPGFGIVGTIGIICTMYILRGYKIRRQ